MKSSITHYMTTQSGLTLIELLVTLAVLSILIAVAAPNFTGISGTNKLAAEANSLRGAFAYARSEAVTRNTPVYVVVADVTITGTAISSGTAFQTGWKVYSTDSAGTGLTLLRESQAMPSSFVVTTPTTASIKSFRFLGDGSASPAADIKFCDSNRLGTNTGIYVSITGTGQSFVKNFHPACT